MSTYRPQQPFKGMTMAQMKKKWQSMTPKERSQNVQSFRDAAKKAPTASKPAAKKPVAKKKSTASPPKANPSSQANKGSGRDGSFGAGTYGSGRESDRANALKMRSIKQPYQGNFPGTPKAEQQTQSSRKPLTPAQRRAARRGGPRKPKDNNKKNRSTFPGRLF